MRLVLRIHPLHLGSSKRCADGSSECESKRCADGQAVTDALSARIRYVSSFRIPLTNSLS